MLSVPGVNNFTLYISNLNLLFVTLIILHPLSMCYVILPRSFRPRAVFPVEFPVAFFFPIDKVTFVNVAIDPSVDAFALADPMVPVLAFVGVPIGEDDTGLTHEPIIFPVSLGNMAGLLVNKGAPALPDVGADGPLAQVQVAVLAGEQRAVLARAQRLLKMRLVVHEVAHGLPHGEGQVGQ